MFGYATDETEECMPLTIVLAHKLNAKMAELRRNGTLPWLRPDSKTQVEFFTLAIINCYQFIFVEMGSSSFVFTFFAGYCPVPPGPWRHASSACAHNRCLCSAR